jgi:hypothetical protein
MNDRKQPDLKAHLVKYEFEKRRPVQLVVI